MSIWGEALKIISSINTVYSFIAFIVFVVIYGAVVVLSKKIKQKQDLINSVDANERARLAKQILDFFHVDTTNLTRQQKYDLAKGKYKLLHRCIGLAEYTIGAIVILTLGVTLINTFANVPVPPPVIKENCDLPFDQRSIECFTFNEEE